MGKKKFTGVIVPMITPCTEQRKIDDAGTERVVDYLVRNGAAPFVIGTTGEAASISHSSRLKFVERVLTTVSGRTSVYAGISSNDLISSVEAAKAYFDLGVDAAVAHLPTYYMLTPGQMQGYFESLVKQIDGPLLIYNIKSTTHMSIPIEVIEKLSHHPNIVGVKDSDRDLQRLEKSIALWKERDDFSHLLGWGAQIANGLLLGSDGLVPSTGNIIPKMFYELYEAAGKHDVRTAERLQKETDDISSIYQKDKTLGESLAALKLMMNEFGLCEPHMLPPLTRLSSSAERVIKEKMLEMNLKEIIKEV